MQIVSGAAVTWSRVPAVSLSAHAASWLCCCAGCFDVCNSAACGVVAVVAVHSCSFWTFNKEKKRKALNEIESQSNSHAHKTPISGCHLAPRLVFMLVVSVGEFVLFMVSCLFSLLSSSISILFCFTLASFPPLLHLSLFCSLHCDCPPLVSPTSVCSSCAFVRALLGLYLIWIMIFLSWICWTAFGLITWFWPAPVLPVSQFDLSTVNTLDWALPGLRWS